MKSPGQKQSDGAILYAARRFSSEMENISRMDIQEALHIQLPCKHNRSIILVTEWSCFMILFSSLWINLLVKWVLIGGIIARAISLVNRQKEIYSI